MGGVTPHRIQFFAGRHAHVMGGGTPHKQVAIATVYGGVHPPHTFVQVSPGLFRQPFHHLHPPSIHVFIIPTTFTNYTNYFPIHPAIFRTTQPHSLSTQQPSQLIQPRSSPTWSSSPPTQASFPPTQPPSIDPMACSSHLASYYYPHGHIHSFSYPVMGRG